MAHLTRSQRDQIEVLVRASKTQPEIAHLIGCHQSTVSRELSRGNSHPRLWYEANKAHERAEKRRQRSYNHRCRWYDEPAVLRHVVEELRDGKSPDQIAGRMRRLSPWCRSHAVGHQSIYDYIWKNKEEGGCMHLHLTYQGKKHKWHGFGKSGKGQVPNRRGIEERPKIVERKKRCGDWESDLVVSARSGFGAVATFAERFSMYFRGILVADQSAEEMVRASHAALGAVPENHRLTMTHDNGHEIAKHEQITAELKIIVYCARPYRSCDRGLNEFMNRELRRYFPKGTNFSAVTQEELDLVVEKLNNRPRRSLQYRTPKEVFLSEIKGYAFHG